MRTKTGLCAVVIGLVLGYGSVIVASGSIKPGGTISPRDAYMQGKVITHQKLVCNTCPISPSALDKARATSIKNSLEARDEANKPGTADDEHVKVLGRDEQEMVHYYLKRRFRL